MNTIRAQVVLDGENSGLREAVSGSQKALVQLGETGKKVQILETAIQNAKDARAAMVEAKDTARTLDEQLALAKGAGAGREAIKLLEQALRDANKEVERSEKAWSASREKLDGARKAAAAAGVDTKNLAAEQARLKAETEAATAALAQNTRALEEARKASAEKRAADRAAAEEERRSGEIVEANTRRRLAAQAAMEASTRAYADVGAESRRAAAGMDDFGQASESAGRKSAESSEAISRGVKSISEEIGTLKSVFLGLTAIQGAASSLSGLAATTDAYSNLISKIKLAVGEGQAFEEAFTGIQDVALRTNVSLEATGELFGKLFQTGKVSQAEALRLTEAVNQAVQLSGASAASSEAAVTQLIQGLQSGVLRGDEFNSVMEQAPRLAKALADGLGVTTGELRKMAEAGQLSSETVINALKGQARALETEFSKLPPTIGRAITQLQTKWQLWIGELDQSKGASASVAAGIKSIADNLDTLAASLMNAGQAYLGWKAYNIAAEMLGLRTAVAAVSAATTADTAATAANTVAKAANTAATAANTAAATSNAAARSSVSAYMLTGTTATAANTASTVANTAAQVANNQAKLAAASSAQAAAASAARLSSAFSLMKGLSLAFLVTNLDDIGKGMGDAAAKAMGYGKVIEESERQMRAAEKAAKDMAAADAELAQKKQLAADAALGLSERSKKLVADFSDLTGKGETTAAALEKIGKDLDLSNIKGIAEAGAALDALAQRGKISADQVQDAWEGALKDVDLQAFEVNARAAFDNTEQGARRLAAALEAQLGEALRRTGKDWGSLAGGINDEAQKAINSFDVLAGRVDEIRAKGLDAGTALAASLNQAANAATTEKAVQAVIDRWNDLGNQGLVTGDRLKEGLSKARQQLDELKPGINSLEEAYKLLGITSQESLKKTAEAAREAYEFIKQNGGAIEDQRAAWFKYAEAAKAANGGILPDILKLQNEMYKLGEAGVKAAEKVEGAWDAATDSAKEFSTAAKAATAASPSNGGWATDTNGGIVSAAVMSQDWYAQQLKSAGVDEGMARSYAESTVDIYGRLQNLHGRSLAEVMRAQVDEAKRTADAAAAREKLNSSSSSSASGSAAAGSSSTTGGAVGYGNVVRHEYVVNIPIKTGTAIVKVADQASVDALARALDEAIAAQR